MIFPSHIVSLPEFSYVELLYQHRALINSATIDRGKQNLREIFYLLHFLTCIRNCSRVGACENDCIGKSSYTLTRVDP